MNPYVERIQPRDNYQLETIFENGERRVFDMRPYLKRGVFARLQNHGIFQAAKVVAGSVEWPGELDLSYDTLYLESRPILKSTETEVDFLADEQKWDALFAHPNSSRLLRTMAADAREEYRAERAAEMSHEDRLASG